MSSFPGIHHEIAGVDLESAGGQLILCLELAGGQLLQLVFTFK
jgi:hypothetical protein